MEETKNNLLTYLKNKRTIHERMHTLCCRRKSDDKNSEKHFREEELHNKLIVDELSEYIKFVDGE